MRRLEDAVREGESSADLVLLVRGGADTVEKFVSHGDQLEQRFTYGDGPARGISLFAVRGDLDTRVLLGQQFRTFSKYRRIEASRLNELGLLLPTFSAPHWTLMFLTPDGSAVEEPAFLAELLAILGPVLDNPKYQPSRKRRER